MEFLSNQFYRFLYRHWPLRKGRTRIMKLAWRKIRGITICDDDLGNRFMVDLSSFIDCHLFLNGSFEKEDVLLVRKLIEKFNCHTFLDIGANIGVFTIPLSAHPAIRKVFAFEPDPMNHAQLMGNVFLNDRHERVKVFNLALSSEAGEADFYIARSQKDINLFKYNRGTSSLVYREEIHGEPIKIQMARLDDLLTFKNEAVAIKIDVEGHELGVLGGMEQFLRANQCVLHIEIFPARFEQVNGLLERVGYRAMKEFHLDGDNFIYGKAE